MFLLFHKVKVNSCFLLVWIFNWLPEKPSKDGFDCFAKFRYRQPDQRVCVKFLDNGSVHLDFYQKQRAVTEGQYAVLYDDNGTMLGGGEIEKVYFEDGEIWN